VSGTLVNGLGSGSVGRGSVVVDSDDGPVGNGHDIVDVGDLLLGVVLVVSVAVGVEGNGLLGEKRRRKGEDLGVHHFDIRVFEVFVR
jgi:hypothetical protein